MKLIESTQAAKESLTNSLFNSLITKPMILSNFEPNLLWDDFIVNTGLNFKHSIDKNCEIGLDESYQIII